MLAAERERKAVSVEKAANRRLELQKQREEVRATKQKGVDERRLQEKKLSVEEAKQKRLNKQRVISESREERLKEKAKRNGARLTEQQLQRESRSVEQRRTREPQMVRSMEQRMPTESRSMEQRRAREPQMTRSMEQRMPRESQPMSQGSIPSQQIFVGSQPKESQNTNSVKTLDMRLKQEAKLNERKQKALRESQKEKMKLEKMRLEMNAKSNSEKRKLEKQEQKRQEKETKQQLELERMRMKSNERQKREDKKAETLDAKRERELKLKQMKSNERQKREEKKAESLDARRERELRLKQMKSNERQKREEKKAESLDAKRERELKLKQMKSNERREKSEKKEESLKEKRAVLLEDKKIKSAERLALKNKALSKQEANEKKRHAKKEEEKEALLAKQSRKNVLRSQKIENNERKEKARKEKKEERKQNDDEKERKKSEKEAKIESQKELFGKLLGMYTSWKVSDTEPTFQNNNTLSMQDITSVDTLVKNTTVKTFARRKIAGSTPPIFANYLKLHKNVAVAYLKSSSSKNKEKEIKQEKKKEEEAAVKKEENRKKEDFISKINDLSIDDLKDVRAYLLAWRPNIITKKPRIVSHVLSGGVKTSVAQQIIKDVIPKNYVIYEWYKTYSRNTQIRNNSKNIKLDSWGPLPEDEYSGIRKTYTNVFDKIKSDINGVKNDKGYDDIRRKWFGRKNTSNVKKSIEDMDGIQEYIIDKELAVLSDKMKCGEITGFKGELHANFKRFMNNKKVANQDKQNAFKTVREFLVNTNDIEKLYIITKKRPKKIDTLKETEGCILRNYLHEHFFTADAAYKMYIGNNKNVSSVFSTVVTKMNEDIDAYLNKVSLEELYEIRRDTGTIYNGKSRKQLNEIGTFKAKVVSIFIKNNIILKLDDALEKIGNLKVHEKLRQAFSVFKGKYEKLKDNPFYKQIVGQALGFDVKIELPKFMVSKGASIKMNAPKPPTLRTSKRFILKISDVAIPRLQAGKLAKLKIPQTSKMTISLPKTTHIIIPKATVIQLKSSTKRGLLSIPRPFNAKYYSINGRVMPFILNVPIKLPKLRSSQSFSLSFHPETPKLTPHMGTLKVPEKKNGNNNKRDPIRKNEKMTPPPSSPPPQPPLPSQQENEAGKKLLENMENIQKSQIEGKQVENAVNIQQKKNIIGRIKTMHSELGVVLEGNTLDLEKINVNVNINNLKRIEKMYLERMKLKRKQNLAESTIPAILQAKEFTTEELEYINTEKGNFENLKEKRKSRSLVKEKISKVEEKLLINKKNVLKAEEYSGTHEDILSKFKEYLSRRRSELEQKLSTEMTGTSGTIRTTNKPVTSQLNQPSGGSTSTLLSERKTPLPRLKHKSQEQHNTGLQGSNRPDSPDPAVKMEQSNPKPTTGIPTGLVQARVSDLERVTSSSDKSWKSGKLPQKLVDGLKAKEEEKRKEEKRAAMRAEESKKITEAKKEKEKKALAEAAARKRAAARQREAEQRQRERQTRNIYGQKRRA